MVTDASMRVPVPIPADSALRARDDAPLPPPPPGGPLHGYEPLARRIFRALNDLVMIPAHRAGLGAWLASPIGGHMLLLRVRGRRSGTVREVPLTYYIADGDVWLIAGLGTDTNWYRNLLVNPAVELVLPGRRVDGLATEERDPAVRARILPAFVRAAGLPALLSGVNPWRVGDEAILQALDFVPLLRVEAERPIEPGPDDPGGSAWIWRQLALLGLAVLALRLARRVI